MEYRSVIAWSVLLAATPCLAQPVSSSPDGSGDPLAITCRSPQQLPDSRLPGPKICKTNAEWARYRKDGMDVAADGRHDVPAEKWRSINPQACRDAPGGSIGSTSQAMQTNFSRVCF